MPRAYTACRSGCALLPSVHVELKKAQNYKKKEEVEKVSMKQLLKNTISSKKVLLAFFLMAFLCFSKHFKLNLRSKHRL